MPDVVTKPEIPGLTPRYTGKVREVYDFHDNLLVVTSDRISAFDVVLTPGIPYKGIVLNCLALFWFDKLADVIPNHVVTTDLAQFDELKPHLDSLRGRAVVVKKLDMLPIEFVVRGYLFGSAWEAYQGSGAICGIDLPAGMTQGQRLDEPILTPSTKAESGHDENITPERAAEIIGADVYDRARAACLGLFKQGGEYLAGQGLTVCDTKFELGFDADGALMLGDEALTPDSSRLWLGTDIESNPQPANLDKQIVRDYLLTLDWDKTPPAPPLPADIVAKVSGAYCDIFKRIVGKSIDEYVSDVYAD